MPQIWALHLQWGLFPRHTKGGITPGLPKGACFQGTPLALGSVCRPQTFGLGPTAFDGFCTQKPGQVVERTCK